MTRRGTDRRFRLAGGAAARCARADDGVSRRPAFRLLDPPVTRSAVPPAPNDDALPAERHFCLRAPARFSALRTPLQPDRRHRRADSRAGRGAGALPTTTAYAERHRQCRAPPAGADRRSGRSRGGRARRSGGRGGTARSRRSWRGAPRGCWRCARDDKDMRIEQPDLAEAMPASGDFKRALQVLVNLVGNAVRYGPEGSTVRVSVERRGGGVGAVVVADQGRGVAPADAERVFEKFERLGAQRARLRASACISRGGWRARCAATSLIESGAGEGARFVFTLPGALKPPPAGGRGFCNRSALGRGDVIALHRAGVELARAADLLVRIGDHLVPLRDPADGAGQREQHGEHRRREADRRQDDARVEIDVREQLLLDEIRIVQSDLLELAARCRTAGR